jgi:hypothetical protein
MRKELNTIAATFLVGLVLIPELMVREYDTADGTSNRNFLSGLPENADTRRTPVNTAFPSTHE